MISARFFRFFREIIPIGKAEWLLCLGSFGIFAMLDYFLAFRYRIIFDGRIPWDAYFSFDNRAIVMTGGGFERHPLSNFFFDGLRSFALWISGQKYDAVFRLVLALCSSLAVMLSLLYLFKYCRNVVKLNPKESWLITLFFSSFSTVWMLFFTPETYTYTLPALLFFVYSVSLKLQRNETPSWLTMTLANILIGGLTITNGAKVYLPQLFIAKNWKSLRAMGGMVLKSVASIVIFVLLFLWRMDFQWQKIVEQTGTQYEKFSQLKAIPFWDMAVSWFWGGPMLFPDFIIQNYQSKAGFPYKALFFNTYQNVWEYLWVGIIFLLALTAIFLNRKNRLVWMLVNFFVVDFAIHLLLKFGLRTAYIYGAHYIFIVPMLLPWLLVAGKNKPFGKIIFTGMMLLLMAGLVYQNAHQAIEFWYFLERYYRN